MKCPHCTLEVHDNSSIEPAVVRRITVGQEFWASRHMTCPSCDEIVIWFGKGFLRNSSERIHFYDGRLIHPRSARRVPIGNDVPNHLRDDYSEACEVLPISAKASAALSRRILQDILKSHGYTGRDLVKQIEAVLNESDTTKSLPTSLHETTDAVRNFGNFSTHPITEQSTLQIVEVEPEEAEWCLEIIEQLFDHYYVRPAANAKRIDELNKKLAKAGKPPMKP